jgi:hypothetical protein
MPREWERSAVTLVMALSGGACSSGANEAAPDASNGDESAGQGQAPPACALDASNAATCITGSVSTAAFSAPATSVIADLFTDVPLGGQPLAQEEVVGADGTWAFDTSALEPPPGWSHYYVEVFAQFGVLGTVARIVGPLVTAASAGPVVVNLEPVHLEVIESRIAGGGAMQFRYASAHVFDPATGAEITNGTAIVAIAVGGTSLPMPWVPGAMVYEVEPSASLDAQPTYRVTIMHPAFGSAPAAWQLVANTATLNGVITAPPAGARVDIAGPLEIDWEPAPAADYVQVDIFGQAGVPAGPDGGASDAGVSWSPAALYSSPTPETGSAGREIVPGGTFTQPGAALINVVYSYATCPGVADGCVYSGTVAAETITLGIDAGGAGEGGM